MVVCRDDPCGVICVLITYLAVGYADYVLVHQLVIPTFLETLWGAVIAVAFNGLIFLMSAAHLRAMLSDPGTVPLPKHRLDFSDEHTEKRHGQHKGWDMCMKCETYRPPRAHHCRICRRCIRRMDHHCPWINNCVGEFNQKFFIQFLFYVALLSIFAVSMVVATWVLDPKGKNYHATKHTRVVHSIILCVESFLFGLFVLAMICDQLQAILTDETVVEQAKRSGPYRTQSSKMLLLKEVFGKDPKYLWLCPFTASPVSVEQTNNIQYNV